MYDLTWHRREPQVLQQRFPSVGVCGGSASEHAPAVGLTPGHHLPARSRAAPPGHWGSQRALCWGWAAGSPGGRLAVPLLWHRRAPGHCESGTARVGRPAADRHGRWRAPARVAGADLVFWARPRSPHQPLQFPLAPAAPPGPAAAAPPTGRAEHWDGTPAGGHMHCSDSHIQHVDARQALPDFLSQMLESVRQGMIAKKKGRRKCNEQQLLEKNKLWRQRHCFTHQRGYSLRNMNRRSREQWRI